MSASSRPSVTVSVAGGILELGVTDEDPCLLSSAEIGDRGSAAAVLAEGGRGLLLVEALADEWGATSLPGGKHVWFQLTVGDWPHAAVCHCHQPGPGRVRLGSGRYALHVLDRDSDVPWGY